MKNTKKMTDAQRKAWQDEVKNERAEMLTKAVEKFSNSESFKEYLKFMNTFHQYSACNSLLIWFQGGTLVAGFNAWKEKGRSVKKGEKAIKIYAPVMAKGWFTALDADGNPKVDEDGHEIKVQKQYIKGFRRVSVFDVSQTEGKELPELSEPKMLTGDMNEDEFNGLFDMISKATTAKVGYEDIQEGNGYFAPSENRIAVNRGMSKEQTIKTLIHEVTHSLLHTKEEMKKNPKSREQKEIEAESVAYIVCSYLGIDSAEYSFEYVCGWSMGDTKIVAKSMDTIKKTADKIIEVLQSEERAA